MAYKTEELLEEAKEAIKNNAIFFVEDLVALLPCQRSAFYEHFPAESDKMDTLKELLEENKVRTKLKIRAKLMKGEKAAELIALYKLICTDEERRALSMQHFDHTTKGEIISAAPIINFGDVDGRTPEDK